MNKKEHLPLIGVGPLIVFGQIAIAVAAIILTHALYWVIAAPDILHIPFFVLGICLIVLGIYLDLSAKLKSKLFKNVEENKLVTDGVYGIVRNPVYSCGFLVSTGLVLFTNNLILLAVPLICWAYMTIFLINTEEKWLIELYGQEYIDYCKRVNRCIPWFPKELKK